MDQDKPVFEAGVAPHTTGTTSGEARPGRAATRAAQPREQDRAGGAGHDDTLLRDPAYSTAGGQMDIGLEAGGQPTATPGPGLDVETYGRADDGRGPGDDTPLDEPRADE